MTNLKSIVSFKLKHMLRVNNPFSLFIYTTNTEKACILVQERVLYPIDTYI